MSRAVGPLGKAITISPAGLDSQASPLILLRRVTALDAHGDLDPKAELALMQWAEKSRLGQNRELVRQVTARRQRALEQLRAQGHTVVRLRAKPEWRLVVGLGNRANPHEIGMSLHGSYGWPIIPGSSVKGLTAAWAAGLADVGADSPDFVRIFGTTASRGSVRFLDAIPANEPAGVVLDVLTPHHQPYYTSTTPSSGRTPIPPAEYHNPIPVHFLTVTGAFAIDLTGRVAGEVNQAADWLIDAGDELGAGAKTTSGYGYLKISRFADQSSEPG
ncbi:MAG: type III-B CRISPR module RAMP protein Cmr6 [Pseudonocardiaceae bacterium]